MTLGIGELIKIYYRIQGKWKVSSKRMLKDLESWDKEFANLLREFLQENNIHKKFKVWTTTVDHIVKPMGGRLPIRKNLCECVNCRNHLTNLLK